MNDAYPPETSWLVQISLPTGEWGTARPPTTRDEAYTRLEQNKREHADRRHRIVRVTTVYTQEYPEPDDDPENIDSILAFFDRLADQQRSYIEQVTDGRPADTESDNT